MLDAGGLSTAMFWLLPAGASFLTTRYWSARDDRDPSRHLWFGLYLAAVIVMVVGVFATTSPDDRLGTVVLFFAILVGATALQERRHAILVGATALQERRHRRRQRVEQAQEQPEPGAPPA